MRGLDGKIAVVTGAARGIGRGIALELARHGVHLGLIDVLSTEATASEARALGAKTATAVANVCDFDAFVAASTVIRRQLGDPDFLVNNAGGGEHAALLDMTPAMWRQGLELNLTSAFYGIKIFCPAMLKKGAGAVVNIASTSATFVWPNDAHYSAAKAGLTALTRCAAYELGRSGVRVNAVSPGTVETPGWGGLLDDPATRAAEARATALQRIAQPADVASVVAFLLSHEAAYITGEAVVCDGGYSLTGQDHAAVSRDQRDH